MSTAIRSYRWTTCRPATTTCRRCSTSTRLSIAPTAPRCSFTCPGGDGNDLFVSPGNLISTPVKLHLDPVAGGTFTLQLDQVLPPLQPVPPGGTTQQGNPTDSAHVKHIKIQSKLLTRFWGQPMYIGANILLPRDYDSKRARHQDYPVIWHQTHFPSRNPFGFVEDGSNAFSQFWLSKDAPQVIVVEIRHENPYFDDSYAVNSANLGPYGDAITKELMPAVDKAFRTIDARWARTITGGSTGGWETIAQQVFYPSSTRAPGSSIRTRSTSTSTSSSTSTTMPTPTSPSTSG